MSEASGWFSRLKGHLRKTTDKVSQGIENIFATKKVDETTLEQLEDLLISVDMGIHVTKSLLDLLRKEKFGQNVSDREVKVFLAEHMIKMLEPYEKSLDIMPNMTNVILIVGVNGGGKTTTIAKLTHFWQKQGYSVCLAAADTFRAAAVSQLKLWADRLGVHLVEGPLNSDSSAVAFKALEAARKNKNNILLIDTAGRLHHRADLMAELEKMTRVLKKIDETAPHQCLMVVDATTGQNLYAQVETFKKYINVSGLIMTKLDGTARGGVLVGLVDRFRLPVYAVGVGEATEDLKRFNAQDFTSTLLGLDEEDEAGANP